LTNCGG